MWPGDAGASFEIRGEAKSDILELYIDDSLGMPLVYSIPIKQRMRRKLDKGAQPVDVALASFLPALNNHIRETLFNMSSSPRGAVTFSNFRIAVGAARDFDVALFGSRNIEVWESNRSARLPWISDLSSVDVLRLREDARNALPRFRARMARALTNAVPSEVNKVVHDLQEEAAEVEAELKALDTNREAGFRTSSGVLGMTIAVYGFAGEFLAPGAALTGLATLLGLIHAGEHKEHQDVAKLTSRPGYVLVKAKELASHAPA